MKQTVTGHRTDGIIVFNYACKRLQTHVTSCMGEWPRPRPPSETHACVMS